MFPAPVTRSRKLPVLKECCEYTLPADALPEPPSFVALVALPRLFGFGLGLGLFFLLTPKLKNLNFFHKKN